MANLESGTRAWPNLAEEGRHELPEGRGVATVAQGGAHVTLVANTTPHTPLLLEEIPFPGTLHTLQLHAAHIASLAPLEHCAALRTLGLNGAKVGAFGALRQLTECSAHHLPAQDLNGLAAWDGLAMLYLSDVPVADFGFVRRLSLLEELYIEESGIEDVSPIASLPSLKALSLSDNPHLGSLAPLRALPHLAELTLGPSADPARFTWLVGEDEVRAWLGEQAE